MPSDANIENSPFLSELDNIVKSSFQIFIISNM